MGITIYQRFQLVLIVFEYFETFNQKKLEVLRYHSNYDEPSTMTYNTHWINDGRHLIILLNDF